MYTRTYSDEHRGILIPESYGGTAFIDSQATDESVRDDKGKNPWEGGEGESVKTSTEPEIEASSSVISKIQMPHFLSNIFKNNNFNLQNIGKEEILLIAAALFLFFSKEGDKECALMLFLLLFLG